MRKRASVWSKPKKAAKGVRAHDGMALAGGSQGRTSVAHAGSERAARGAPGPAPRPRKTRKRCAGGRRRRSRALAWPVRAHPNPGAPPPSRTLAAREILRLRSPCGLAPLRMTRGARSAAPQGEGGIKRPSGAHGLMSPRSPKSERGRPWCLEWPRRATKWAWAPRRVAHKGPGEVPRTAAAPIATPRTIQVAEETARGRQVPQIAPPSTQAAFVPRRGRNKGQDGVRGGLAAAARSAVCQNGGTKRCPR